MSTAEFLQDAVARGRRWSLSDRVAVHRVRYARLTPEQNDAIKNWLQMRVRAQPEDPRVGANMAQGYHKLLSVIDPENRYQPLLRAALGHVFQGDPSAWHAYHDLHADQMGDQQRRSPSDNRDITGFGLPRNAFLREPLHQLHATVPELLFEANTDPAGEAHRLQIMPHATSTAHLRGDPFLGALRGTPNTPGDLWRTALVNHYFHRLPAETQPFGPQTKLHHAMGALLDHMDPSSTTPNMLDFGGDDPRAPMRHLMAFTQRHGMAGGPMNLLQTALSFGHPEQMSAAVRLWDQAHEMETHAFMEDRLRGGVLGPHSMMPPRDMEGAGMMGRAGGQVRNLMSGVLTHLLKRAIEHTATNHPPAMEAIDQHRRQQWEEHLRQEHLGNRREKERVMDEDTDAMYD